MGRGCLEPAHRGNNRLLPWDTVATAAWPNPDPWPARLDRSLTGILNDAFGRDAARGPGTARRCGSDTGDLRSPCTKDATPTGRGWRGETG
ncbi:hypothetical protein GCM10011504_22080 [Siccirubricoccus deserti]|nr:hypothetical protein GCM10011504_22080 [Siccirubricoccus deserti]